MEKPIMINGFPRSGTTYLYRYLKWLYGVALFEPLTSPQVAIRDVDDENIKRALLLKNPFNKRASFYRSWWIYDEGDLREFLGTINGIPFKEVSLHFYLNLVEEGWNVFHIMRHPADNYISYVNYFHKKRFWGRRLSFYLLLKLASLGFDSAKFFSIWEMATRLVPAYLFRVVRKSFDGAFIFMWVLANREAIRFVGEKRLIVYEKPESFEKLPRFEEFQKRNPFKMKKYPEREKVMNRLRREAERLEILDDLNELLQFF